MTFDIGMQIKIVFNTEFFRIFFRIEININRLEQEQSNEGMIHHRDDYQMKTSIA